MPSKFRPSLGIYLPHLSPSVCGRQPLKNLKGYGLPKQFFKGCLPQVLLVPFLNTLSRLGVVIVPMNWNPNRFFQLQYFWINHFPACIYLFKVNNGVVLRLLPKNWEFVNEILTHPYEILNNSVTMTLTDW